MLGMILQRLSANNTSRQRFNLFSGSIVITFTVEGSTDSVTLMQQDLCTAISEGQSYSLGSTTLTLDGYMTVDGQPYYGVSCAAEVWSR